MAYLERVLVLRQTAPWMILEYTLGLRDYAGLRSTLIKLQWRIQHYRRVS